MGFQCALFIFESILFGSLFTILWKQHKCFKTPTELNEKVDVSQGDQRETKKTLTALITKVVAVENSTNMLM